MAKFIFYFMVLFAVTSYGSGCATATDPGEPVVNEPGIQQPAQNLSGCYQMVIGKDSAKLYLEQHDGLFTGKLSYKPFEKDKSNGTIRGTIANNLLKTWYTFQSEGLTSVREVYFKLENGKLAEGYGDVELRKDSIFFKYPHNMYYERQHLYERVDCN